MKVLDLQCAQMHVFEGWFASERDFIAQRHDSLIACPLCGNLDISKRLSAPRLNLGHHQQPESDTPGQVATPSDSVKEQMGAWLTVARRVIASADDVGDDFALEARKMHHGEAPERTIRGTATREDTIALMEEGIDIVPFELPELLKETLQ